MRSGRCASPEDSPRAVRSGSRDEHGYLEGIFVRVGATSPMRFVVSLRGARELSSQFAAVHPSHASRLDAPVGRERGRGSLAKRGGERHRERGIVVRGEPVHGKLHRLVAQGHRAKFVANRVGVESRHRRFQRCEGSRARRTPARPPPRWRLLVCGRGHGVRHDSNFPSKSSRSSQRSRRRGDSRRVRRQRATELRHEQIVRHRHLSVDVVVSEDGKILVPGCHVTVRRARLRPAKLLKSFVADFRTDARDPRDPAQCFLANASYTSISARTNARSSSGSTPCPTKCASAIISSSRSRRFSSARRGGGGSPRGEVPLAESKIHVGHVRRAAGPSPPTNGPPRTDPR